MRTLFCLSVVPGVLLGVKRSNRRAGTRLRNSNGIARLRNHNIITTPMVTDSIEKRELIQSTGRNPRDWWKAFHTIKGAKLGTIFPFVWSLGLWRSKTLRIDLPTAGVGDSCQKICIFLYFPKKAQEQWRALGASLLSSKCLLVLARLVWSPPKLLLIADFILIGVFRAFRILRLIVYCSWSAPWRHFRPFGVVASFMKLLFAFWFDLSFVVLHATLRNVDGCLLAMYKSPRCFPGTSGCRRSPLDFAAPPPAQVECCSQLAWLGFFGSSPFSVSG